MRVMGKDMSQRRYQVGVYIADHMVGRLRPVIDLLRRAGG
jgi:hypothetical protein